MAKFSFHTLVDSISKLMAEEQVNEQPAGSPQQLAHEAEIQNAIIILAADVIRCDRNYTTETQDYILQFFIRQFSLQVAQQRITAINKHLTLGTNPLLKIACKELKMLTTHDSRLSIIQFLFGVADADDFVNPKEIRAINRIANYLGIADKDFKEIKQAFIKQNNPYKLLGIDEEETIEQIKAAYRKMVLKYHPDKREAHVTEEDANAKFRDIQRAFDLIKKQRE